MAAHGHEVQLQAGDSRRLEGLAWPAFVVALSCGIGGLVLALIAAFVYQQVDGRGFERLGYSYLVGFAYVLSLAMGCLLFVMLTFLFRAGWVVLVRRPAEIVCGSIPILAALLVPILVFLWSGSGVPYIWAQEEMRTYSGHHGETVHPEETPVAGAPGIAGDQQPQTGALPPDVDHPVASLDLRERTDEVAYMTYKKQPYLSAWFFTLRWVIYLASWSFLGLYYYRTSTRQDLTGDPALTRRMEIFAAPGTLLFAVTFTFAAFDLLMTLDPTWYSSMFGIYFFAGSFQATFAFLILTIMGMQRLGYLPSVTTEHYHDLAKLMFAFVVFWAYTAFSQYLLIWYGTIPAEQRWMIVRGMSTNADHGTPWQWVALIMLFGRFFIPFFGLMSRHVKRRGVPLAFWCVWVLVIHLIDMHWLVMPEYDPTTIPLPIVSILCVIGTLGVFFAVAIRLAAKHSLVPVGDPRLRESLAFQNI